jgi:hypothetical protein
MPGGDVSGRALVAVDVAAARVMTAGIREAIGDVRRPAAVLAERVRAAHEARVWVALAQPSWAAYCEAEFGISRAQAYRLFDIARAAGVIRAAVTAADPAGPDSGLSRMRDSASDSDAGADAVVVVDFRPVAAGSSGRRGPYRSGRGPDHPAPGCPHPEQWPGRGGRGRGTRRRLPGRA